MMRLFRDKPALVNFAIAFLRGYPKTPLSLRKRAGVRGSKRATIGFISPHPNLLPRGEGMVLPFTRTSLGGCRKSPLSLRERSGVRESKRATIGFISPHPNLLPGGEGMVLPFTRTSLSDALKIPLSLCTLMGIKERAGERGSNAQTIAFTCLILLNLCLSYAHAANISWQGQAGGDWHEVGNWSGGTLPGPADDVSIDISAGAIKHVAGETQVHSLTLKGDLQLQGGSLTVSGASQIQGMLTVAQGATLAAQGAQATLSVTGAANIDGGNVFALAGAQISLPGATRYQGPGILRAQGAGSRLDLSAMTDIGIGSPGTTDIKQAISRAVSVYHKPIQAPEGGSNKGITSAVSRAVSVYHKPYLVPEDNITYGINEAISRAVSVYHKPYLVPEDDITFGINEAISRAVSVYHKPYLVPEDDITFGINEAISRAVSVYHKPYAAPEDPETLGIRDAYSRQLTIQNGAQP